MPIVNFIPSRYEEGFKELSSISDEKFESIKEGLSLTALVSSLTILAEKVADIQKLDVFTVREIFLSAGSLAPFLDKVEKVDDLVEDVANISVKKKFTKDKSTFVERVKFLLTNKHLYFAAKSDEIVREYGNVYISSRIITDIRPVFDIDVDEVPKGGLIVHNLHIHYQADEERGHKDIYIALDSNDVKALKEALIRAEKKQKSLKSIFDKSGMTNLNE